MRPTPAIVVTLVLALVAAVVVLGEPSRPATATVVRPVVTVPALCSSPTVIDVAARDATRGLTAIGDLLALPDELVGEAARDLSIVDTDAGAFFVLVRDDELRVAALSPAGLPIVNAEVSPPQTSRAFALGDLEGRPSLVVGGPDGVFVVFGGAGAPVEVFAITPATLASSLEVSVARDRDGPVLADPAARAGAAAVHDGVLWLASDDGRVVTFDPLAESGERWAERADGLVAPLITQGQERVHGVFETTAEGASVEVRSFPTEGEPDVTPIEAAVREVTGVSYAGSIRPVFAVATPDGGALLRPDGAATTLVPGPSIDGDLLGLVATEDATAVLAAGGQGLHYQVVDRAGEPVGTFASTPEDRCVDGPWPDGAAVIEPISAGSLLHLHDPSSGWDCVADTRDPVQLAELTERCSPGGAWSVDKGSAPARDFTVEIGRALDELGADDREREAEAEEVGSSTEAIQEELSAAGLGVTETEAEVDEEAADECAAEEVTSVAPPVLDLAEPVGARAVRVEWSWNGGSCLPGRYLVAMCQLADRGTECADTTEQEVTANPTSARSSLELAARPDRTYRVRVRAAKGEVVSEPSGALLVTTPAVTPDPPVSVSGALRDGTWRLAWSSCLAQGDCEQRPDGFLVTVEGCQGDGLGRTSRRFDVSQRSTSFGADGADLGVDLLGRRVQFHVATTSGERVSEPVRAGGCTTSVRPGRDAPASQLGLSLTGRAGQVTLATVPGGRPLAELFGTTRFDDVRARLIRGGTTTASRTGALSGPVTFDVRCAGTGWTVELTPRWNGRDQTAHRSRLTDAAVACDPSVDSSTRISTSFRGASAGGIDLRVTIPGLGQDVENGLVDGVSGRAVCAAAFGGEDSHGLSGGSISGDEVSFTMPVPVILDLQNACRIAPVVAFRSGASAAPSPRRIDLDGAGRQIVDAVLPVAVSQLERARTGAYAKQDGVAGVGNEPVVAVRHAGSGVPCSRRYGASLWSFEVSGTRFTSCSGGEHAISYGEREIEDGDGRLEVRVELGVLNPISASTTRTIPVCELPGGEPRPPCAPEPCEHDPSIPADDPGCFEPCEHDPSIPADDPGCVAPEPDPGPDPPEEPDPTDGSSDGTADPGSTPAAAPVSRTTPTSTRRT